MCPMCNLPMVKIVRPNGSVYLKCKVCGHIEETNEIEPPSYNSWGYGYEYEGEG